VQAIRDMKQPLADLRELVRLAEESDPNTIVEFSQIIRSGAPLLTAHIDKVPAGGTTDIVVVYEVADQVQAYLTALRAKARNGGTGEVVGGFEHEDPSMKAPVYADRRSDDSGTVWRIGQRNRLQNRFRY
jgi:hypothetical protein